MKKNSIKKGFITSCFFFMFLISHAQLSKLLNTSWQTDENTTIQITEINKVLTGKQIASKPEKYKPYIGKITLENIKANTDREFTCLLSDTETEKKYDSKLILSEDGKTLSVK